MRTSITTNSNTLRVASRAALPDLIRREYSAMRRAEQREAAA